MKCMGLFLLMVTLVYATFSLPGYLTDLEYPELVNGVSHYEQTQELCLTTETFYYSDYGTICAKGNVFPADLYTDGKFHKTQIRPYSFLNCRCIVKNDKSVLVEIWHK
ncbi:MAG: hypothetical protein K2M73_07960 [Lachnospiraceae bacterium]|nr:hypothetical protein [Lachnospiraceae bacterium]